MAVLSPRGLGCALDQPASSVRSPQGPVSNPESPVHCLHGSPTVKNLLPVSLPLPSLLPTP